MAIERNLGENQETELTQVLDRWNKERQGRLEGYRLRSPGQTRKCPRRISGHLNMAALGQQRNLGRRRVPCGPEGSVMRILGFSGLRGPQA